MLNPLHLAADIIDPPEVHSEWFAPNPDPDFEGDPARLYEHDGETLIRGRARPKQRPPLGDWFVWLLRTGRGFGKTRTAAEHIDNQARKKTRGEQILIAGRTPADVRTYSLYGEGGLLTHHPDIDYSPSNRELTWPNGVKGIIRSGANPEEFRGYSGDLAWLDEFAAWDYPKEAWHNLMLGVRERDPRIVITTTPRPIEILAEIIAADTTVDVQGSTLENRANLSERWVETVVGPVMGTRLGRQEIEGEMVSDAEFALWRRKWIERDRVRPEDVPQLIRVIVGVDPQGRAGAGRMTGIVVVGEGVDGHYYVLMDASISGTPAEWGEQAIHAYRVQNADMIVGEVNYGGEMVEHTIATVDKNVPYENVHASRGKRQRAEPVSTAAEKGRVHHVGAFPELEDELCKWTVEEKWSPNRLDAMVWAASKLMFDKPTDSSWRSTWLQPWN